MMGEFTFTKSSGPSVILKKGWHTPYFIMWNLLNSLSPIQPITRKSASFSEGQQIRYISYLLSCREVITYRNWDWITNHGSIREKTNSPEYVASTALFSGNVGTSQRNETVISVKNQEKLTTTNHVPKPKFSHLYPCFLVGNQYT